MFRFSIFVIVIEYKEKCPRRRAGGVSVAPFVGYFFMLFRLIP